MESLQLRLGLLSAAFLAVIISNHIKCCMYLQILLLLGDREAERERDEQALQLYVTLLSAVLF